MNRIPTSTIHPSAPDALSAIALFTAPINCEEVLERVEFHGKPLKVNVEEHEGRHIFSAEAEEFTLLLTPVSGTAPIEGTLPPHNFYVVVTIISPLGRARVDLPANLPDDVTAQLRATMRDMHNLYTPLMCSLMAEDAAVGVARPELKAVFPAHVVLSYGTNEDMSFMLWIRVAVNRGDVRSGRTYGLNLFGHLDLLIAESTRPAEDIYDILANTAGYIITNDAVLMPGQTLGKTEDQQIAIVQGESEGVSVLRLIV